MRRCIAAAIANTCTSLALYPLETSKIVRQVDASAIATDPYAGVLLDMISSFWGALIFFMIHASAQKVFFRNTLRIFLASVACACVSSPINVVRRKVQVEKNIEGFRMPPVCLSSFWRSFIFTILRNCPRTLLKYTLYYKFMTYIRLRVVNGFTSGFMSSFVSYILLYPLDYVYVIQTCDLKMNTKQFFSGIELGILHNSMASGVAHFILEILDGI